MNKVIMSDVFVSKGFEDAPAVRYSEKSEAAFFTVGIRVYDPKADNNHRFINLDVKAFGDMGARIKKMDVRAGSRLNIVGRLDQDTWDDSETKKKRTKTVIILEDVEYGFISNKEGKNGNGNGGANGNGGQNGYGNGYGGPNGYGDPGMGAAPYGQQMPPQYQQQQPYPPQQQPLPQQGQMPNGFTGYENFSGNGNTGNPYFGNGG